MNSSAFCVLAVCTALSGASLAQNATPPSQTPSFRAGTTLVEVTAIVTKEGKPVTDLRVSEIEVLDNGLVQPLVAFEYVDQAAATQLGGQSADFVLVLDDLGIAAKDSKAATDVALALVDALAADDRLAIVNTGPFPLIQQLSTDRNTARKLVRRFLGQKGRSPLAFSPVQLCHHAVVALGVLENALQVLSREQARRRAVLVLSEGHRVYWVDSSLKGDGRCDQARAAYERVISASAAANASIYGVDVRGLQASAPAFSGRGGPQAAAEYAGSVVSSAAAQRVDTLYGSLGLMASATGGTLTAERNNLATGVHQMIGDSREYYRLAYVQPDVLATERGKSRRIEVRVRRDDVDVRARQRYVPR